MKTNTAEDIITYLRDNIQDDNHPFIIDIKHKGRYRIKFGDGIEMEFFDDVDFIGIYTLKNNFTIPKNVSVLNETIIALDINFGL